MSKRTKRMFFYAALAVFLFLSIVIIFYAQGYKYSLNDNKFLRTGAIALKANTGARVYLNDKLQGNTSFFNSAYSIDRLLPGEYRLSVQKDDYSIWQKKVVVDEGLVTDFPEVLILPEEGEEEQALFEEVDLIFEEIEPIPTLEPSPSPNSKNKMASRSAENVENKKPHTFILDSKSRKLLKIEDEKLTEIADEVIGFRLSENQNKIAWWTSNELWVMWLNDQKYQPFKIKGDRELITRFNAVIRNGAWFRGEDHLVLELEKLDLRSRPYSIFKVVEIDKRGGLNIIDL